LKKHFPESSTDGCNLSDDGAFFVAFRTLSIGDSPTMEANYKERRSSCRPKPNQH